MRDTSDIKDMRDALMAAVIDLAKEHPEVVFLDSDLSSCINSGPFAKEFPNRFFNCGIAEANMVGVASGLSSMGFVPYAHSFGCFASDVRMTSSSSLQTMQDREFTSLEPMPA